MKKIRVVEISAIPKDIALEQVLNDLINAKDAKNRQIITLERKHTHNSLHDGKMHSRHFYRVVYQDDV